MVNRGRRCAADLNDEGACPRAAAVKGYCPKHYTRLRRTGSLIRYAHGHQHTRDAFTCRLVRIATAYGKGVSLTTIARRYRVSKQYIFQLARRYQWPSQDPKRSQKPWVRCIVCGEYFQRRRRVSRSGPQRCCSRLCGRRLSARRTANLYTVIRAAYRSGLSSYQIVHLMGLTVGVVQHALKGHWRSHAEAGRLQWAQRTPR